MEHTTYQKQLGLKKFAIHYWHIFVLTFIIGIATVTRLLWLGSAPQGALVDEMHYGYIAWSILETGKDEHGVSFPLIFRGFGDNKLPGQVYTLVPFIKLFGLDHLAIRLPSALAGVGIVLVSFFLARAVRLNKKISLTVALIAALIPWTFVLSRFGFESNLGLLLWSFGILTALYWLRTKQSMWAICTALVFGSTWYFYISFRPLTLALLLVLLCLHIIFFGTKSNITNVLKTAFFVVVFFLIVVAPFLLPQSLSVNTTRLNQVGIFNDPIVASIVDENRTFCVEKFPTALCYPIWNKGTILGTVLIQRWFHAFSPQFLATQGEGEIPYLTIAQNGQIYLLLYPFFLFGTGLLVVQVVQIFTPVKNSTFKNTSGTSTPQESLFILSGLVLTPLPSLLVGNPQPVRMSAFIPFMLIAIGLGIQWFWSYLPKNLKAIGATGFFVLLGWSSLLFFVNFYSIHVLKNDIAYDSHLPAFFEYIQTIPKETTIAYNQTISDPIMYYAYYTKIHPTIYQEQVVLGELEASGFQHALELGNFISTEKDHVQVGCDAYNQNKKAVFATRDVLNYPILYSAKSFHGVHTYIYVYDIMGGVDPIECKNR